jgi:hypothetical protein
MDRNDLLAATRDTFMRGYADALPQVVERSIPALFNKADHAKSSADERRFFAARQTLVTRGNELRALAVKNLQQLITRSFQTAYNAFQSSNLKGAKASSLSLLDQTAFEDDLRIDTLTQTFRDEADEQLRDLNIRIALLFDQETIKERENPFRPYLLTRSIANAVESMQLAAELNMVLIDQLCEGLLPKIDSLYASLNKLLSEHGIAAQLQLKIRKVQGFGPNSNMPAGDEPGAEQPAPDAGASAAAGTGTAPRAFAPGTSSAGLTSTMGGMPPAMRSSQAMPTVAPQVRAQQRVDRLIDWVRNPQLAGYARSASGDDRVEPFSGTPEEIKARLDQLEAHAMQSRPANGPGEGMQEPHSTWLATGESAGSVLRRVFSSGVNTVALPQDGVDLSAGVAPTAALTTSIETYIQQSLPAVEDMYDATGAVRNLILERRPELGRLTDKAHEQMTIDIVAMLFEFILRDTNIPAEVRAQLGRLQFLVLKTALRDPEFFSHKSHPARMLVNRIGSISLSLKQVDPSGEHVTIEIRRIVEKLLADTSGTADVFAEVLDEFDQFVARELRASDEDVERAAQAMESVQSRTLQFARITAMISDGLSVLKIDQKLHHFLVHTWARVVERAGRHDAKGIDRETAQSLRALVPDLIWSIAPKVTEANRKQLLKMLPNILKTMRAGLDLIDWTPEQKEEWLGWLIDSHTFALRVVNVTGTVPPLSFIHDRFRAFLDATEFESKAAQVEIVNPEAIDPLIMGEAIREMKLDIDLLDEEFRKEVAIDVDLDAEPPAEFATSQVATAAATEGEEPSEAVIASVTYAKPSTETIAEYMRRLKSGVAVEVNLYGKPSRATLTWVSANANNLVLSMEGRRSPAVISAKLFKWLVANKRARFLEDVFVFERAMESLLASADASDQLSREAAE